MERTKMRAFWSCVIKIHERSRDTRERECMEQTNLHVAAVLTDERESECIGALKNAASQADIIKPAANAKQETKEERQH